MTHNLKALRDLEKRLAEATDRDLGLDGDILEVVDLASGVIAPPYTTSLDAAVALVERVLPNHRWIVDKDGDRAPLYAAQVKDRGATWGETHRPFANTPALALCLAFVRALIAQGEQ